MLSAIRADSLWQDARFGVRDLFRNKGFALTAAVSLALGIGAATAMYSVIYGVVLNPLPYRDIDNLFSVAVHYTEREGFRTGYNVDEFLEIAERNRIFSGTIASTISDVQWAADGEPRRLRGNHITANTFEVMGVGALVGRVITPSDTDPESLVVLGFRCWQREFGGDLNVIGRRLRLNDRIRTVVGVMPPRFMWRGADVYLPLDYRRGQIKEGVRFVHVLGRLKPGITATQAAADLHPIIEDLKRRDPPSFPERPRVSLVSFKETFPSSIRGTLWTLFGAVGLLLFIACANVSNLLLVKAAGRRREIAVRSSLGAGRARLVRQLLTESLLLGVAGGALGVAGAYGALRAILAIMPPGVIPDESEIVINRTVLLFSIGIAALTSLLFGIVPALQSAGRDLNNPLRDATRSSTFGRGGAKFRSALVVVEVMLSLILLTGASLMGRTLLRLNQADIPVRTERQLTMRIFLTQQRYSEAARRNAFWQDLLPRVRSVPGVLAAGINTGLHPLGNRTLPVEVPSSVRREGRPVRFHQIDSGYLDVFAIALVRGRTFDEQEVAAARHVALVNEEFVRRYFDAASPLGHAVRVPELRQAPMRVSDDSFEIVGVVRNAMQELHNGEPNAELYIPYSIAAIANRLVVHTQGDPSSLSRAVAAQVYAVDASQPVAEVRTLDSLMQDFVYARPRFGLALLSVFAGIGLAIAVIGVYGVLAHIVAQRRQELGVRMAVGATAADILGLVLRGGLRLVCAGIVLGLASSLVLAKVLQSSLPMADPFDPLGFGAAAGVLLSAGILACLYPAIRATRVDPASALRTE